MIYKTDVYLKRQSSTSGKEVVVTDEATDYISAKTTWYEN